MNYTTALNLFSPSVNSIHDEPVKEFKNILDELAKAYGCKLVNFAIKKGTIISSFDNKDVVRDILVDIEQITGVKASLHNSPESFLDEFKEIS